MYRLLRLSIYIIFYTLHTKQKTEKNKKMSQSTTKSIIFIIIGLIIGAGIGYVVTNQTTSAQITNLQNQLTELQTNQPSGNIVVKGSDTLLIVGQRWAEEYMNRYSGVSISVAGGGSGVGIAALIDGTTDIADASREIKESEITSVKANGVNPVEWTVGLDGISIIVNEDNPITELSLEQLEKIYNGTYITWSQITFTQYLIVNTLVNPILPPFKC